MTTRGFRVDSNILERLGVLESRADTAIAMFADSGALKLQQYAQEHARWTDRTGHARQRLNCKATKTATGYKLTLAHGVNYGIWLELRYNKKYAIINDTIRHEGKTILRSFERLLDNLGR